MRSALLLGLSLLAGCTWSVAARAAVYHVDQVEVVGVTVFHSEAIEPTIEVSPGDELDKVRVLRSAEDLQTLYRVHGYEQAKVQPRLVRRLDPDRRPINVLEFIVTEGSPTRIAEIDFVRDQTHKDVLRESTWQRIRAELKSKISLRPGSVFDQEKVADGKRILLNILSSEDYIAARADEINISQVEETPALQSSSQGKPTARWVKLEFNVQLGDRVSFGFRGNSVFSDQRLRALIDEQRILGFGPDYVGAIHARILELYRALGYAKIRATPYTFEVPEAGERHVTYVIDEGPRMTIKSVEFEGNTAFSSEVLNQQFFDRAPPLIQRGYYVETDVQKAADLLIEWIKSQGYLGAKLITVSKTYEPHDKVSLKIYLYEWEQTLVRNIQLSGLTVFKPEEVAATLSVAEGKPLNLFAFSEGIESLKAKYRSEGYLDAKITNEGKSSVVTYSDGNRLADILLQIDEGPQYRVSGVRIEGRRLTREKVIARELSFKEGDVLREPALTESEARLRKLGIFDTVKITPVSDPEKPGYKIVNVSVNELDPGIIAGGPGFRNDLGVRAFTELGYTNLGGLNQSVFLDASANRRLDNTYHFLEYNFQLSYNWPWFADWDIDFRPTVSFSGTEYLNFDATTAELDLNWQKTLLRSPNLSALFTYSLQRVNQFNAPAVNAAIDDGIFRIGSIIPGLKLDMRDNPLAPTSGLYVESTYEVADPILGSQRTPSPIGYTRFQFRSDYNFPFTREIIGFVSFRAGYERSTASSSSETAGQLEAGYGQIPLIKQFALGGIGSLRGFEEQALNYRNTAIFGSLSYVNYRFQVDFPLSGGLKFGPFLDAANLLQDRFSFGSLRYGSGVGFHYLTPIGAVNLDWGYNLFPQPTDPGSRSQFYFSIGVI